jgi:hypothetical protein
LVERLEDQRRKTVAHLSSPDRDGEASHQRSGPCSWGGTESRRKFSHPFRRSATPKDIELNKLGRETHGLGGQDFLHLLGMSGKSDQSQVV